MSDVALTILPGRDVALYSRLSSDERLAGQVSHGDVRAFELLYERHCSALYRYCRSILRDDEDAKDALQNAMTAALAALQASERDVAVRPWLFRIVHNEAISLMRRRRPTDSIVDEHAAGFASVEHTAEENERLATLVTDLQSLGERHRAALVMRELCGNSIAEIAATLSTSPGAAKQALFEARTALHELVEGRAMECDAVQRMVSERDGRILRGRKVRAHLRACSGCEEFRGLIVTRTADLRLLAPPVPAAVVSAWLAGGGVGTGVGGMAGGGSALTPLAAKLIAGMTVVAAATSATIPLQLLEREPAPTPSRAPHGATPVLFASGPAASPYGGAPENGATGEIPRRSGQRPARADHGPGASRPIATAPGDSLAVAMPGTTGALVQPAAGSATPGQGAQAPTTPGPSPSQHPAGLPPGLAKHDELPPGLAKRDELPSGLAKRDASPPGLAKHDEPPPGQTKHDESPPGQAKHDEPPHGQAQSGDATPATPGHGHGPPVSAPGQQAGHGTS